MNHKDIKSEVITQLKKEYPNWKRIPRKIKKQIAGKVLKEVVDGYDFKQDITTPTEKLLGIENQIPIKGIITLDKMAKYIEHIHCDRILKFSNYNRSSIYIKDEELQFIDQLVDDRVINTILSYDGYSPAMRDVLPCHCLRAELLKAVKYPEISYRKFCTNEYFGLDRKQNRVFMGLPLHTSTTIEHTRLSKFRSSLTMVQQVNLLVYFIHHFHQSGLLGNQTICGVDSTELANDCSIPLASVTVRGKNVRIYSDLDCDCGSRRNKRDKSVYVVGYRLHTLTVIDAESKQSFPLVSLVAPANHHDSHFLPFLIKLAQAMGLDIKLVTADEAYHDKDGSLFKETGVIVTTPPSSLVNPPVNVAPKTGEVFCHCECTIPMRHVGSEGQELEYKCNAEPGQCLYSENCPQYRFVTMDRGLFQRIPFTSKAIKDAREIRKNCERSFNLLKNQTGLEKIRVRSQHATMARCTFGTIAVLLIKMAGKRKKKKIVKEPRYLLERAANM